MTILRRLERWTGTVTSIAGLAAVSIIAWRELRPPLRNQAVRSAEARTLTPELMRAVFEVAGIEGSTSRLASLVIFTDVECPFCATLGRTLDSLTSTRDRSVDVGIIHFPLPQHKFARLVAYALECARLEGRMHQLLSGFFSDQGAIGLRPWSEFAAQAGVLDTARFSRCVGSTDPSRVVDSGLELGRRLGLSGTPSVLVDSFLLSQPPQGHQVHALVDSVRAGASVTMALRGAGYVVVPP